MKNLYNKINKKRHNIIKQHYYNDRLTEKEIKEHEYAHARQIKDVVEKIEFTKIPNKNGIEFVKHGKVYVNTNTSHEMLKKIKNAADIENKSEQDLQFKKYVSEKIRRYKK